MKSLNEIRRDYKANKIIQGGDEEQSLEKLLKVPLIGIYLYLGKVSINAFKTRKTLVTKYLNVDKKKKANLNNQEKLSDIEASLLSIENQLMYSSNLDAGFVRIEVKKSELPFFKEVADKMSSLIITPEREGVYLIKLNDSEVLDV